MDVHQQQLLGEIERLQELLATQQALLDQEKSGLDFSVLDDPALLSQSLVCPNGTLLLSFVYTFSF